MAAPRNPEPAIERPQPGPQEAFLATSADIAVYGGAAGGGKTWALLFEPLRHLHTPGFSTTIFRRTYPQIKAQGGLWAEATKLYSRIGGRPNLTDLRWIFASGVEVKFAHLQHEHSVTDWDGSQIPLIEFDELTHFTEHQFIYMLQRNRSTCGVKPYIRATTMPDAASWVARWVEWWIDQDTGLPIPERAGRIRWFVRDGESLRWGDDPRGLEEQFPGTIAKSFTFIPAKLEDNQILMRLDPGYLANLLAQPRIERERKLRGNWLISNAEGEWPPDYFGRDIWFDTWPADRSCVTIAWDPSKGTDARWGDYSAFAILHRCKAGRLWADAVLGRWSVEEGVDIGLELCRTWRPQAFAVEVNQFQSLVASMFLNRALELKQPDVPLYTIDNRIAKHVRIRRLGPLLANRVLRFKGGSTGAKLLVEQLQTFPNGDHDDGPDALEMALRVMSEAMGG